MASKRQKKSIHRQKRSSLSLASPFEIRPRIFSSFSSSSSYSAAASSSSPTPISFNVQPNVTFLGVFLIVNVGFGSTGTSAAAAAAAAAGDGAGDVVAEVAAEVAVDVAAAAGAWAEGCKK